jgi:hypothetical protein
MSKKNNDSIEKFFRKAVSQYDTSFRESDWKKMEEMLDANTALRPGKGLKNLKRAAIVITGIVILSASIYFPGFYKRNTTQVQDSPQEMQAAAGKKAPRDERKEKTPTASLLSSEAESLKNELSKSTGDISEKHHTSEDDVLNPTGEKSSGKRRESGKDKINKETASLNYPDAKTSAISGTPENLKTESVNDPLTQKADSEQPEENEAASIPADFSGRRDASKANVTDVAGEKLAGKGKGKLSEENAPLNHSESKTLPVYVNSKTETANDLPQKKGDEQLYGIVTEKDKAVNDPSTISEKSNASKMDVPDPAEKKLSEKVNEENTSLNNPESKTSATPGIPENLETRSKGNPQQQKTDGDRLIIPAEKNNSVPVPLTDKNSAVTDRNLLDDQSPSGQEQLKDTMAVQAVTEKEIAVAETRGVAEEDQKKNEGVPSRWSVVLNLAPDFSSTSFGQMTSPGGALGIQIGYRIFPRISVHTGLIKSAKKYKSAGSHYQPPEGYWGARTNGRVPDQISGQCSILEIPLWLQYDVTQRDRSRIYVSGGVSSYLMTSESYDYTFETANPGAAEGWSSSGSSSYPFAIGHISAGYERNITPALGLGIEPFVKIPFGGIGWSNVNLYTTGFYVNVRYRFLRRIRSIE